MTKSIFRMFLIILSFLPLALMAETESFDSVTPQSFHPVSAYTLNNQIYIEYTQNQNSLFLSAKWPLINKNTEKGYTHLSAPLNLSDITPSRLHFSAVVPVIDYDYWQLMFNSVLEETIPDEPFVAAVLYSHNEQFIAYKNLEDKVILQKLVDKPDNVAIGKHLSEEDIHSRVIQHMEKSFGPDRPEQVQMLIAVSSAVEGKSNFLFIDLDNRFIIFLSQPYDSDYIYRRQFILSTLQNLNYLMIRSQVVSALKAPFTFIHRGSALFRQNTVDIFQSRVGKVTPPPTKVTNQKPMNIPNWLDKLDRITHEHAYPGNIDILIDGKKFFPELRQQINNAKHHIYIRTYIFDNDDFAINLADLLKKKAREGVDVRILIDGLGSKAAALSPPDTKPPPDFTPPGSITNYFLKDSSVKIRETMNPLLTSDHTKTIHIDDRIAFTGGMNIGREYRSEWHDLMLKLSGPITSRIKKDFEKSWAHAGPAGDLGYFLKSITVRDNYAPTGASDSLIRPVYTKTGNSQLLHVYLAAAKAAQKEIYIATPYFTDRRLINALIKARHRGVDVHVILPSDNDAGIMGANNIVVTNLLIKGGVRVHQYPGMSHMKAAIFDGWACVGSANLDRLSLRRNQEFNISFTDKSKVEQMKQEVFEADIAISKEVTSSIRYGWTEYFSWLIANQL